MKLGYMTNAFGPLVGEGGGVTSIKDIRFTSSKLMEPSATSLIPFSGESIVVLVVKTSLIRSTEAMEIDNMTKIIINIMSDMRMVMV